MTGSIGNFVKSIFMTFLVMFLLINLAMSINYTVGLDFVNVNDNVSNLDFSDKYFGISSLLNGWDTYWAQNTWLSTFQESINFLVKSVQSLNWTRFAGLLPSNTPDFLVELLSILLMVANSLFNILYILGLLVVALSYVLYGLTVVVQFIIFIFYFLSGHYWSKLPDTYHIIHPSVQTLLLMYA